MRRQTIVVSLLLLVIGCSKYYQDFELDERSFDHATMQMIQTNTGINLPPDARGLNFFYKAPIDPSFLAKIEIPAGSQAALLAQLATITNEHVQVSSAVGSRIKWWTPTKGKVLIDRQRAGGDTYYHAVLTDDGGRLFLYFDWSM